MPIPARLPLLLTPPWQALVIVPSRFAGFPPTPPVVAHFCDSFSRRRSVPECLGVDDLKITLTVKVPEEGGKPAVEKTFEFDK